MIVNGYDNLQARLSFAKNTYDGNLVAELPGIGRECDNRWQ